MSELNADKSSDLSGNSAGAGPVAPNASDAMPGEPAQGAAKDSTSVEPPKLAAEQNEAG